MRIVNMSLVIIGAIACLNTVSFSDDIGIESDIEFGIESGIESGIGFDSMSKNKTAPLFDIKFSGGGDFRWKFPIGTTTNGDKVKSGDDKVKSGDDKVKSGDDKVKSGDDKVKQINGLTRSRMDLKAEVSSPNGKGKAYFAIRYDGVHKEDTTIATYDDSTIRATKAYVDYIFGPVILGIGPKIGFPGSFSDSTVAGIVLKTNLIKLNMAKFDIAVAIADRATGNEENQEKSIITAHGGLGIIEEIKFDYRLGANKEDYLATSIHIPIIKEFKLTAGYASGLGDNNKNKSIMGVDTEIAIGSVVAYGAFSMSGKGGGEVTEKSGLDGRAMGDIRESRAKEALAMQFGTKLKMLDDDLVIEGYWSNSTPSMTGNSNPPGYSRIYIDATYDVNQMASANIRYYIDGDTDEDDKGEDTESLHTVELRFASKF